MKDCCIIHFEHRDEVTSIVELHREFSYLVLILYTMLDHACVVIPMFKIDNTISFHRITVTYDQ